MKMVDQNTLCKADMLKTDKDPSTQKCSVSVCRIDTTLGPGATIIVSDGGCRHIIRTPEHSSSSFKVYEDKPASKQCCGSGEVTVLQSSSGGMLTKDEVMKDRPQQLATPEAVITNLCQRNSDKRLYAKSACDKSVSAPSKLKLCDTVSSDSDKTLSPPSSSSVIDENLMRFLISLMRGRAGSNESQKTHKTSVSGGSECGLRDRAGGVKEVPAWSIHSEGNKNVSSGTQLSRQLKRVHLYSLTAEGSSPLEFLVGPVAQCETPSPASTSNSINVPCKAALRLPVSDQGVQPSKKKRVSFADEPELSSVRCVLREEGDIPSRQRRHSPFAKSRWLGRRRTVGKCRAAGSSGTSPEDGSPVSVISTGVPNTDSPCEKDIASESSSSPDLSGMASQGSVDETATELLNSQDPLFPPLMDCANPIESIATQLMTELKGMRAFVNVLQHKNIHTVGDLSRLDEASINRLPIASPKIATTKAVLQGYMKLIKQEGKIPLSVKEVLNEGDKSRVKDQSTQSSSTEICQRSVEDFLKSSGSNSENLAALLKEVMRVWSQDGSGPLEEGIPHLLPVEVIARFVSSRLANDLSFSMPLSDYQKIMDSIVKSVTHTDFVTLFYNAVNANSAQNTGCP